MAAHDLPERVIRFLERQRAWTRHALDDLASLDQTLANGGGDLLLENQQRRDDEIAHLLREQAALLREWRAAENIPAEISVQVQALSAEVKSLTAQLAGRYEEARQRIESALAGDALALEELGRGRELLNKYRPTGESAAGFLDHHA